MCKQIIDKHQGHMGIESTPGAGTTVMIDFMRADVNDSNPVPDNLSNV